MSANATLPEATTHQHTRMSRQQLVLSALPDRSSLSRVDLTRLTGLTRISVGDLADTLIDHRIGLPEREGVGER